MKVYDEGKEQDVNVGTVDGDVFTKHVKRDGHFYFKGNGYCYQSTLPVDWYNDGVKFIRLIVDGTKELWLSVADFHKYKTKLNQGHGEQYCVDITHYKEERY